MSRSNPYEILGVERDAPEAIIKAAYRRLAKQHHPDAGGNTDRFADIAAAWELLGDPHLRAQYDATGRWNRSSELNDPIAIQAMQLMGKLVMVAYEELGSHKFIHTDVVAKIANTLKTKGEKIEHDLHGFKQEQEKLERFQKRFTRKTQGASNVLASALQAQIDNLAENIRQAEDARLVRDRAVELLADHEFQQDQRQVPDKDRLQQKLGGGFFNWNPGP